MTDTSKPAPAGTTTRDDAFVQSLLKLRHDTRARSALRRGASTALADRALPYLAPWKFAHYELTPALLFSAAITTYPDIAYAEDTPLGRAAFRTLSRRDQHDAADTNPGRRVMAAQRQQLPLAHRTITSLLTRINDHPGIGLDWPALWRMYRVWDHPDPHYRRRTRRQLLLDFHGTTPAHDDTA
ncbi:type I-E CRISPR-associated protein Cse2/CasB [Amycolatopsis lurida]